MQDICDNQTHELDLFPARSTNLPHDPAELTDSHLSELSSKVRSYDRLVGSGLILRVLTTGKISFRYNYRMDGKQRVVTLGTYPRKSLRALRAEYDLLAERVSSGEDVTEVTRRKKQVKRIARVEKKEQRKRQRNVLLVETLVDVFVDHLENPNTTNKRGRAYSKKTLQEYQIHLHNYVVPAFGKVPVRDLRRKKVSDWLKEIAIKKPTQANRIKSTMLLLFKYTVEEYPDDMEVNLLAGLPRIAPDVKKTRALDYDADMEKVVDRGEIKAFWHGMDNVNPLHRTAMRLVLMTLLRPGEVLNARWEHIFDDEWVIPISHTKSKKSAHKVPLDADLKRVLRDLRKITGETGYLFPQSRYEDGVVRVVKNKRKGRYGPVRPSTVSKVTKVEGLAPFTPHDLRRTGASHLVELGFMPSEIGMLLHHSTAGVTEIYAQGSSVKRKKKMLNAWHKQLKLLVE